MATACQKVCSWLEAEAEAEAEAFSKRSGTQPVNVEGPCRYEIRSFPYLEEKGQLYGAHGANRGSQVSLWNQFNVINDKN